MYHAPIHASSSATRWWKVLRFLRYLRNYDMIHRCRAEECKKLLYSHCCTWFWPQGRTHKCSAHPGTTANATAPPEFQTYFLGRRLPGLLNWSLRSRPQTPLVCKYCKQLCGTSEFSSGTGPTPRFSHIRIDTLRASTGHVTPLHTLHLLKRQRFAEDC